MICHYCRYFILKQEATIDHKISKWFYGKGWNNIQNKVNSCYLCNLQKGIMLEGEYLILLHELLKINNSYILERNTKYINWYMEFLLCRFKIKRKHKNQHNRFEYGLFFHVVNNSKIIQDVIKAQPEIINSYLL